MGKTYENVSEQAETLATIERARIIREVEASMSPEERLKPALSIPALLFKDLFVDEAGEGKGKPYWKDQSEIVPPPVMAFPLKGLCLVMNMGESEKIAQKEAASMDADTKALAATFEQHVAVQKVLEHRTAADGSLEFLVHSCTYLPSPVCGADKMVRTDTFPWKSADSLRIGRGESKHLTEYLSKRE